MGDSQGRVGLGGRLGSAGGSPGTVAGGGERTCGVLPSSVP